MHQQLWGYKVEEKLYLGVREQKRLNTTDLDYIASNGRMIDGLDSIWKEATLAYSRYYPGIRLQGPRKTTRNLEIAGIPTEIRTDDIPDTSLLPLGQCSVRDEAFVM
jgi:hypothetical protein